MAGGADCACLLACPLGHVVGAFEGCPLLSWRVLSFCPLSRFVFGALLANMALFRVFMAFLAGFGAFVWVCVACVLCVACGAFVRVWS